MDGRPADWLVKLARFGYAAKGFLYGMVGVLALMVAFGEGGATTGTRGAIHRLAGEPFGGVLLGLVAAGLFAYSAWRLVQVFADPENHGDEGWKKVIVRITFAVSAVTYGLLGVTATKTLVGAGTPSDDRTWTAQLMQQPWGRWAVMLVGLIVIGVAIRQFQRAYEASFMKRLRAPTFGLDREKMKRVSQFGIGARGVVFSIIGFLLITAGWNANPDQARGLDAALTTLQGQPWGSVLLGIVAAGLVAYGVYCALRAKGSTFGGGHVQSPT